MSARRRAFAVSTLTIAAVAMSGCSQIDSLKQVSGVPVNTLQIAVDTVLIENKVPILVAPVCEQTAADANKLECPGKTTSGQDIVVTATNGTASTKTLSPGGTPTALPAGTLNLAMVVKVGGKTIYEGHAQTVIDKSQGGAK